MQDILLIVAVTGIVFVVLVYVRVMQKLMRTSVTSQSPSFSLKSVTKKLNIKKTKKQVVPKQNVSVMDQIKTLEKEMFDTDDGDKRRKILDKIRALEANKK